MKKAIFFAMVLCLGVGTALAGSSDKRLAVGGNATGDIGISFGMSGGKVLHGAVSLRSIDRGDDSATTFGIWGGFDFPMVQKESVSLNLQPNIRFESAKEPSTSSGLNGIGGSAQSSDSSVKTITPAGDLVARVWVGDSFSVDASAGIAVELISNGDNRTNFGTRASGITELNFRFWFDPK